METKQRKVYKLSELDELIRRLRTQSLTPDEIERRRKLGEESDRFVRDMEPMTIPVEELIHRARRYDA
jgi:hypothetical protein